jgi:hypothetical protein
LIELYNNGPHPGTVTFEIGNPVAISVWPERRGGVKGAPVFGAATRTLDGEHRSGIDQNADGRRRGEHVPAGELRALREEWGFQRGKKP